MQDGHWRCQCRIAGGCLLGTPLWATLPCCTTPPRYTTPGYPALLYYTRVHHPGLPCPAVYPGTPPWLPCPALYYLVYPGPGYPAHPVLPGVPGPRLPCPALYYPVWLPGPRLPCPVLPCPTTSPALPCPTTLPAPAGFPEEEAPNSRRCCRDHAAARHRLSATLPVTKHGSWRL